MKEKFTKQLKEVYSFSHSDNEVKRTKISPEKFLQVTYKEYLNNCKRRNTWKKKEGRKTNKCETPREYRKSALFGENIKGIKDVLQGKKKSEYDIPIPFLTYDSCRRPVGHEGRHTMVALKSLGVKKAPVTITHRKFQYNWEQPCKKKKQMLK